jgi:hypothetical protein
MARARLLVKGVGRDASGDSSSAVWPELPTIHLDPSESYDVTQHVPNWDASHMSLILQGTALPAAVTFNGTHLVRNSTPGSSTVSGVIVVVIDDEEDEQGATGSAGSISIVASPQGRGGSTVRSAGRIIATATPTASTGSGGGDTPTYIDDLSDYEILRLDSTNNGDVVLDDAIPAAWAGLSGGTYGNNNWITGAWSGGAYDSANALMFIHGGGHSDSANNGLYQYDFNGDTEPEGWTCLDISPTPASCSQNTDPTSTSPNRPVSIHSYAGPCFDPVTNKFFRYAGSQWDGGAMPTKNWAYDLDTGLWTQTPNTPYGGVTPVASIISPDDRKVLVVAHDGNYWFHRIDTNAQGFADDDGEQQAFDSVGAYDPTRSRGILLAPGELHLIEIDWSGESITWTTPTPTGASAAAAFDDVGALFYDEESDVFWILPLISGATSMTTVYSLHPTTWAVTAHTTSGDRTGFDIPGDTDGSFNKICWMPQWRAVGFCVSIVDSVYVMKLPVI